MLVQVTRRKSNVEQVEETDMSDIADRVKKIVIEHLGVDAEKVKAELTISVRKTPLVWRSRKNSAWKSLGHHLDAMPSSSFRTPEFIEAVVMAVCCFSDLGEGDAPRGMGVVSPLHRPD
jgi:hypothetical protein